MEPSQQAHDWFQSIVARYADAPDVSTGKSFGSTGLKTNRKVFAMLIKDKLVVKLPRTQVDERINAGRGTAFDPGHGRLMKEWLSIDVGEGETEWHTLVDVAKAYVSSGSGKAS
jgi:TfoX/Sxy family transcriptional regulator of competence genes